MVASRNTLVGLIQARRPATQQTLYRRRELPTALPRDQWTPEHLLDVCAIAQEDAYDLMDSQEYVECICRLAIELDATARQAKEQLEECRRTLEMERADTAIQRKNFNLERAIAGVAYCDLAAQMERRDRLVVDDMEDTLVVDADWLDLESE